MQVRRHFTATTMVISKRKNKKCCQRCGEGHLDKCRILDFGSGHDLTVNGIEPLLCTDSTEPAWDSHSLSLCPCPDYALSLSK